MTKREPSVVGRNLKRLRTQQGLTLEVLAERSGLRANHLCRFETGHIQDAQTRTLQRMAEGLGVGIPDLFASDE